MKKFFKEFRDFVYRGNVIDMAVGVIVGAAFTSIVNSLVKDIINPLIGLLTGGIDFGKLVLTLKFGDNIEPLTLNYGLFISAVFNFLIVAFVLFAVIKSINNAKDKLIKQKTAEQKKEAPATPEDIVLLREIRDLLKK